MAKKKTAKKQATKKKAPQKQKPSPESHSNPKFPYCTVPGNLRKFLALVPNKPKPPKINNDLLSAWNLGGHNSNSIIRVLKSIGLVGGSSNEPTTDYEVFMYPETGPSRLGELIRAAYSPLFEAAHLPHNESDDALKRYFNIHSGGGERTIQYQIQTFKALCDHANFDSLGTGNGAAVAGAGGDGIGRAGSGHGNIADSAPKIHIDLHIHLPPNKTSRDYQAMFEDIGKYIYGRMEIPDE